MRQVAYSKNGGPEVLELRDVAIREPGPGEVRIRTEAAGIGFMDVVSRLGLYPDAPPLPAVPGNEVSGVVDALGSDVPGLAIGDRVLAVAPHGGYSEMLCASADFVIPVGAGISLRDAAGIPVNYLTAWTMLMRLANLEPGDRVLIHGVGGGVGQAALAICRWREAVVYGTASASKHERLYRQGVAACIDYREQDVEREIRARSPEGVDVVLDCNGGRSFQESYRLLAPMGRLCLFGFNCLVPRRRRNPFGILAGLLRAGRFHPLRLIAENRGVFGLDLNKLWGRPEVLRRSLESILDLVAKGELATCIDRAFAFEEAAAAHTYIQERRNFGKILLVPG